MKTTFVNPGKRRKHKRKSKRRNAIALSNPRRKVSRRRHRRNAGITSFVQNPLILGNPRRRRRSNPAMKLTLKGIGKALLDMGGGAAVGFAVEEFINTKIPALENQYANLAAGVAVRLGEAMLAAKFLPADMGMAAAGALMSESVKRVYATVATGALAAPSSADLGVDLGDMDEILDDLEVEGF